MAIVDKYAEMKGMDRPLPKPLEDPQSYVIPGGTSPHETKPDHRLEDLYPNIGDYQVVDVQTRTSPEWMALEWECFWPRTWVCAGFLSDIPEVGDWFKYELGKESFIVVRSGADDINAFYNVCRHRGRQIVENDFGQGASSFTCPFHSWCYGLDGRNRRVTDGPSFDREVLRRADLNLQTVSCETWGNFVFINMDGQAPPLLDYLGPVAEFLAPYRMASMHVVKDVSVSVPANWKLSMDAFQEAYHLHYTHPQGMFIADDHYMQYDFYPNGHNRMLVPVTTASHRLNERDSLNEALEIMLREAGIDPEGFEGGADDVRRAIQLAKRRKDNPWGLDYSGFSDNQLTDDWNVTIFPNMTFNTHPEGVLVQRYRPHPTDPNQCFWDVVVIVAKLKDGARPPAYMGVEPEIDISGATRPDKRYVSWEDPQVGELLQQDLLNIPYVGAGCQSRSFQHLLLSRQELRISQFYAELDKYVGYGEARSGDE